MKTYYYETQYPNYLMHFGVKGMKWGVRKAVDNANREAFRRASKMAMDANKGRYGFGYSGLKEQRTWQKASAKAKQYRSKANQAPVGSRKALRYQYKSEIQKNKADSNLKLRNDYLRTDVKTMTYRSHQSYGKSVAKKMLLGNTMRLKYDNARSSGLSRGKSAVNAMFKNSVYEESKRKRKSELIENNLETARKYDAAKRRMKEQRN